MTRFLRELRRDITDAKAWGLVWQIAIGFVLLALKLCGVIDWSWWWVALPFWSIPLAVVAGLVMLIGGGLAGWCVSRLRKGVRKP